MDGSQQFEIRQPFFSSRSTLLIPEPVFSKYVSKYRKIHNLPISIYLRKLLKDKDLEKKIGQLVQLRKWKKKYQEKGQNLIRLNFYPDDRDWARLTLISRASGYSRCFIFVYLLLQDMETQAFTNSGTPPFLFVKIGIRSFKLFEKVDIVKRIIKRRIQYYE